MQQQDDVWREQWSAEAQEHQLQQRLLQIRNKLSLVNTEADHLRKTLEGDEQATAQSSAACVKAIAACNDVDARILVSTRLHDRARMLPNASAFAFLGALVMTITRGGAKLVTVSAFKRLARDSCRQLCRVPAPQDPAKTCRKRIAQCAACIRLWPERMPKSLLLRIVWRRFDVLLKITLPRSRRVWYMSRYTLTVVFAQNLWCGRH